MFFKKIKTSILFLMVLFFSTQSHALICSKYVGFKKFDDHYYAVTAKKMAFSDAQHFAKKAGGHLAIPDSKAENIFLASLVKGGQYAWIGIYDPNYTSNYCKSSKCEYDDSRFRTVKKRALTYRNWAYSQPDNLIHTYDIVNKRAKVAPLGEHWVALASPSGKWADFGNHFDEYNNPVRYYGIYEFNTKPECYSPSSKKTDKLKGTKCNTKIYDNKLNKVIKGKTFKCQKDKYNTNFCPSALASCDSRWDYDDGWSKAHKATRSSIYGKIRVWVGKIGDNYLGGYCKKYNMYTYFNITDLKKIKEFKLKGAIFDDWLKITVNGYVVRVSPFGGDRLIVKEYDMYGVKYVKYSATKNGSCELGTNWNQSYNINVKNFLKKGLNQIKIEVIVAGNGEGYAYFEGVAKKGAISCRGGYCKIDPIGSKRVTESYTYYSYHCKNDKNQYGKDYGKPANAGGKKHTTPKPPKNNCKREGFKCKKSSNRKCVWIDSKWQCSPFPCLNSGDIINSDTEVGSTDANNKGWDESGNCMGQIYVFNGQDNRCRSSDIFFGLSGGGCCDKDKVFLGLVSCKEDEIRLAKLNQQNRCHYVGEYCSKKVKFIGCLQHKRSYCCFNSKLSRIVNEQGRLQLKKGWGSAKSPSCKGFTPQEFQKLDFSQINMSEFFGQIQKNFNVNFMKNRQKFIKNNIKKNI